MKMENVQYKVTSTETVKPSSPTPPHLRTFRLSLYDQLAPTSYVPLVLFYPYNNSNNSNSDHNNNNNDNHDTSQISFSLKKSLSETLSKYYPLAGRFTAGVPPSVDCNDKGVTFLDAQFECSLHEILNQPELTANMNLFFPPDTPWKESDTGALLVVQASFFQCGGFAVGACMSHKIADAATVCNFVNDWSIVSRHSPSDPPQNVNPELFAGGSVFPSRELPIQRKSTQPGPEKFVTRRLTFDSSKITNLKSKIAAEQNPTRVQAVTALIYKSTVSAAKSISSGVSRPSVVSQTVNMRSRMDPPLPRNAVGNIICPSLVFIDQDHDLSGIVGLLNKGVREAVDKYARYMKGEELWSVICEYFEELEGFLGSKNASLYRFTSWCRYPLYEVDFGWGNPVWAGIAGCSFVNTIMMDGRGGEGIEAWVTLEESDMAVFERDPELLAFGSLDSQCI